MNSKGKRKRLEQYNASEPASSYAYSSDTSSSSISSDSIPSSSVSSESYEEYNLPPDPAEYGIGEEIDTIVLQPVVDEEPVVEAEVVTEAPVEAEVESSAPVETEPEPVAKVEPALEPEPVPLMVRITTQHNTMISILHNFEKRKSTLTFTILTVVGES